MKAIVTIKKEVDIKFLQLDVNVRYADEDMPYDFPFREGDSWKPKIDIDQGLIIDWPNGVTGDFYMKVCDMGSYYLLDKNDYCRASIENDYVPNRLIPGDYGDYIEMKIDGTGKITNWLPNPTFDNFDLVD